MLPQSPHTQGFALFACTQTNKHTHIYIGSFAQYNAQSLGASAVLFWPTLFAAIVSCCMLEGSTSTHACHFFEPATRTPMYLWSMGADVFPFLPLVNTDSTNTRQRTSRCSGLANGADQQQPTSLGTAGFFFPRRAQARVANTVSSWTTMIPPSLVLDVVVSKLSILANKKGTMLRHRCSFFA